MKLVKNFRSHNSILKFPNDRFYKGELQPCGHPQTIDSMIGSPQLVSKAFPVVFHAMSGKDDREASSPSFFNIDEVTQVKTYVQELRADRRFRISKLFNSPILNNTSSIGLPADRDIGIIAPYHAQCLKIRAVLRPIADGIKVGSVEEFQGQVCNPRIIS